MGQVCQARSIFVLDFSSKQHQTRPRACATVSVQSQFPIVPTLARRIDDYSITSRIVGFARADSVLLRVRCRVAVAPSRSWSLRSTTPQSASAPDSTPSIHLIFGLWTTDFKIKLGKIVPGSCSLPLWTRRTMKLPSYQWGALTGRAKTPPVSDGVDIRP